MKKTLIATSLILAGCGGQDADPIPNSQNINTEVQSSAPAPIDLSTRTGFTFSSANTKVIFNPITSAVSLPSFTLFSASTDGTASSTIDLAETATPVKPALNDIDGWSTSAPINLHFKGELSTTSPCTPYTAAVTSACLPNVFLIPLNITTDGDVLDPSVINPSSPVNASLLAATQVQASSVTLETGHDSLRISPVAPLASKTLYLLAVTDGLLDNSNQPAGPSETYQVLSDTDDASYEALGYPAALSPLRTLIRATEPIALGTINAIYTGVGAPNITQDNIIYTHLFTTTDPTTPLNALAHPAAGDSSLAALPAAFPDQFANPRTSGFYSDEALIDKIAELPQAVFFSGSARLIQGAISLPSYSTIPTSTDTAITQGMTIQASRWTPTPTIAAATGASVPSDVDTFTTAFNGTDIETSTNVTYRYPFPAKQGDTTVPVTIVTPDGVKPDGGWPVVILIHGFNYERSTYLLLASSLANACNITGLTTTPHCFASVMIDLPLHGHSTNSTNPILDIALPLDSAKLALLPSSLQNIRERHNGLTFNQAGATPAEQYLATGAATFSGSFFLNLAHFQNTRDNLKQAVMDHLNVLASLATMDVDSNSENGPDFNTNQVYLAGHSLGGIVGLITSAAANVGNRAELPRIQATAILNSGGHITRLLENSANTSFGAPALLAGLSAAGIDQNTKNYETFFNIFQAVIDSADAVNFATQLTATLTPSYFMVIAGDGSEGSSDQTMPQDADNNPNTPFGNAQAAPLAGTEPLIRLTGAVSLNEGDYSDGDDPAFNGANAEAPKAVAVRFTSGQHSTAALPANAGEATIFTDMVNHISTFFTLNGRGIEVTNISNSVQ